MTLSQIVCYSDGTTTVSYFPDQQIFAEYFDIHVLHTAQKNKGNTKITHPRSE